MPQRAWTNARAVAGDAQDCLHRLADHVLRQWVLPSMDAFINLKSEGKIIGGGFQSERGL